MSNYIRRIAYAGPEGAYACCEEQPTPFEHEPLVPMLGTAMRPSPQRESAADKQHRLERAEGMVKGEIEQTSTDRLPDILQGNRAEQMALPAADRMKGYLEAPRPSALDAPRRLELEGY